MPSYSGVVMFNVQMGLVREAFRRAELQFRMLGFAIQLVELRARLESESGMWQRWKLRWKIGQVEHARERLSWQISLENRS